MFRVLFYQPTFNILIIFYNLIGNNLGLAIVAVAFLSRLITYPITKNQIKFAKQSREMQKKVDVLKKKYKKNKEKLNEELVKLQSKYLPSQIGGCLPMIILIMLLLQVRSGIVNLVDKGWHAYNEIAYTSSLKRNEDYVKYETKEDLSLGTHTLKISVKSDNGVSIEKGYEFEITEDINARSKEIRDGEKDKSESQKLIEKKERELETKTYRATGISLYSEFFAKSSVMITIKNFLIFPTDSKVVYLTNQKKPNFEFYIRPPSNHIMIGSDTKVFIDDKDVTSESSITQGDAINLDFLGMDLSKVAADYSLFEKKVIPYIILALLVGGSQYLSTLIISGFSPKEKKKEEKKKKDKKADEEMPDMSEMMGMASKQMMIAFPLLTTVTSLGYFGGSNIFPSGLSIFWTVQSLFVIIQQVVMNRNKIIENFKLKFLKKSI